MRVARRIVHALLLVITLIVGATVAAIVVSQTAWFKNWLRGYIVAKAGDYLNGQLTIERLAGNLFYGVELQNVGVSIDGSEVVAVQDLGLDYNAFDLITKGLTVDAIRLTKPTIYLKRDGDTWSIARLVKQQEQEADRSGPQFPIAIDHIGVSDASVVVDDPVGTSGVKVPTRIDRIDAALAFRYEPVRYSIEISHVSFRASHPELALNALSGGVSVKDDTLFVQNLSLRTEETSIRIDGAVQHYLTTPSLNVQVSSDKLSLPEIARLVPALDGIRLQPAFEIRLNGPLDALGVDMNVRSSAGQVTGQLVADVQAPGQAAKGRVTLRHLDLAPLLRDPASRSDLTADLAVDVQAADSGDLNTLRGTLTARTPAVAFGGYRAEQVEVDAALHGRDADVKARVAAYGAQVDTGGTVRIPTGTEPVCFDVSGHARRLDVAKLPRDLGVPAVRTDVFARYHAKGAAGKTPASRRVTADVSFEPSTLPGVRIAGGSTAGVTLAGTALGYRADATATDVDLQTIGQAFDVPALQDERLRSRFDAHIVAEGRGTDVKTLTAHASGTLSNAEVVGGRIPSLTFDASVRDDSAHVTLNGLVEDLNPATASGRPALDGHVGGQLVADATVTGLSSGVTADSASGTAQLTFAPSVVGGLAIESATADVDYRDRQADVRHLEVVGRDLHANARGLVALGDTGDSTLEYQLDTPRLEEIGRLFDVPVAGILKVDGRLSGNRAALQATGTLSADGLKYQENGALNVDGEYTARVPELDAARAEVDAHTRATFVTVGGQNINEVEATTRYAEKTVTFDVKAAQPQRTLDAAGTLVTHPDHQEVHLTGLSLTTAGQQWQIAKGQGATVNYADGAIGIDGLRLDNGGQSIVADGRFGTPGDALTVGLRNVDLAGVDALLLRPPQLTGTLNAEARVEGTREAPSVQGRFDVAQGGFRQFHYDTLGGTATYEPRGIRLDTRLQQSPTQWISAAGFLPATLFSKPAANAPGTAQEGSRGADAAAVPAPDAGDAIDLTIESSPLSLGLVQGLTTAVTDAKGTLEAHVRVTGRADDPQPSGYVQVNDGGLTLVPLGVTYSNIAGRVDLEPDKVHIEQITILDNHQSALSITGDLAVRERQLGGFQIWVNADDFKVIDNAMGNVRIQSALSLSGQLRSPIVQGYLGVTTGQVNLDEIVAAIGASPYPTEAAAGDAGNTPAVIAQATVPPPTAGPLDNFRVNLTLTVPNDLVVKASNLQTPGSPVSLGALNVTLGGDLTLTREPGDPAMRLTGAVNTIRGNYDFQGRRFEILRDGTVRFEGLDQINPTLDLRTRRLIQGVEARVNVRGTLQKPEIELSSTPPLEQADILSLIVFNQPLNQLGEGQQVSLAQRAQAIATGAVAGQLAQSIGNALNLDTFEINVAPENGGGPELTLGQQLGQNLYLKVQQGIGEQSSTNVVLEYEIARWLRLQTNVMQGASTQQSLFRRNQGSGADFIFTFSY